MKKTLSILMLLCVLLLSACGNNVNPATSTSDANNPAANNRSTSEANIVQTTENHAQNGGLRFLSLTEAAIGTLDNAQGYYESIESGLDDGSHHIVYTDFATATRQLLCNDQNCAHNDDSCISWLPLASMPQQLFTNTTGTELYYIGVALAANDSEIVGIYAYDLAAGSRREVCSLAAGEFVEGVVAVDDAYLYATVYMPDSTGSMKQEIRKVDIANGATSTIATLNDDEWLAGAFADKLVICRFDGTTVTYLLQSVSTGEQAEAFSYTNSDDIYVELLGEKLFVLRRSGDTEGDVTLVDLRTGEETALYTGFPFFDRDVTYLAGLYNSIAVFNVYDNRQPDAIIRYCYALQLDTSDVSEITLTYQSHNDILPLWVVADAGDYLLVVTERREEGSRTITGNDGVPYDIPVEGVKRALISKADYLTNQPNYNPIDDSVVG